MKRFIVIFAALALGGASLGALELGDYALAIPVLTKTLGPLALIPGAIQDTETLPTAGIALGLLSVPNALLLYNVATANPQGTTFWRNVTKITDGLSFVALAGYGSYLLATNDGAGFNDIVGTLMIVVSLPLGGAFGLDFIPYSFETP